MYKGVVYRQNFKDKSLKTKFLFCVLLANCIQQPMDLPPTICKILGNYSAMRIRCIPLCVYDSWNLIKTEFTIQGLVVSRWDRGVKFLK